MLVTGELRHLLRDVNSLRARLIAQESELQNIARKIVRCRDGLNDTSSEAEKISLIQLQEKARAIKTSFDQDKGRHEELQKTVQEKGKQEEHQKHELADLILKRFEQDCDRCVELGLPQPCTFPENSHCCVACTDAAVRCSGDVDWQRNDLLWHAGDPIRQQLDEFLLEKLADASEFKGLMHEEQRLLTLEQPYLDMSRLTTEEREESSRLHTRRLEVRRSLEQTRANSFWDLPEYQQLWSLYEVLSICEIKATRRWSDYDEELNELTGYPRGRNLPAADEMTEEEFRTAVAWVKAHPYYEYDDSLTTKSTGREGSVANGNDNHGDGDAMDVDEAAQQYEAVGWPQISTILAEMEEQLKGVKCGLSRQLEKVEATSGLQQRERQEICATLLGHGSQTSVSLRSVEMHLREIRLIYDRLEQKSSEREE